MYNLIFFWIDYLPSYLFGLERRQQLSCAESNWRRVVINGRAKQPHGRLVSCLQPLSLYACDTDYRFASFLCRVQTVKVSLRKMPHTRYWHAHPRLKCDRNIPCGACVRRGCPSICPEGKLVAGKGSRFALFFVSVRIVKPTSILDLSLATHMNCTRRLKHYKNESRSWKLH
jgi:hypothetical protein